MNTLDHSAWVCPRDGDSWSDRTLLDGFVNHIWQICEFMPEGNPISIAIDFSGLRLLYSKFEIYECIDDETNTYMSYLATGVEESPHIPQAIFLSLYPNPFNSSLHISVRTASEGRLHIYDITGRTMRSYEIWPSHGEIIWDGKTDDGNACPSGVYFVRLAETQICQKAVLLK
ncbi:MAG: hypothetical protein A2Z25_22125 [Planctomycetes bacterium RBG_16_55_9]|nr:MAG: hypothetical protein A2Z25_22125 [Planctomycetes bacterium RBG_16_55_9]